MTLGGGFDRLSSWLDGSGPQSELVLSSRVRLARNLGDRPFPHRADAAAKARVWDEVRAVCASTGTLRKCPSYDFDALPEIDRQLFVERHIASTHLAKSSGQRGVVVGLDEALGVAINEEDHLRIQSVTSGLDLEKAWERARKLDRELEGVLDFVHTRRQGYLTACPTNVGTGLRASLLIHLPALVMTGEVKKVHRAVGELGMVVRGFFGEGSGALGDFYQLSNQRTLGKTEEESLRDLQDVARRVLKLEEEARAELEGTPRRLRRVEDRAWRARATLCEARLLSVEQLMACASDVRLGQCLGFWNDVPNSLLNRLALFGQPAHLRKRFGETAQGEEAAWLRAEWVRGEVADLSARLQDRS